MDINAGIVEQLESRIADLELQNSQQQELIEDLEREICYLEEESNLYVLRAEMRLEIILAIINSANEYFPIEDRHCVRMDYCKDCGEPINILIDGNKIRMGLHGQECEIENSISF